MSRHPTGAALAACALLLASGCSDDDAGRPPLTLDDVWPHAVGSAWTFEVTTTSITDSTLTLPTELPTLESLHADLESAVAKADDGADRYSFIFTLQDSTTAPDGLPAQAVLGATVWDLPDTFGVRGISPLPLGSTGAFFARRDSALVRFHDSSDEPAWVYLAGPVEAGGGFTYSWPASVIPPRALHARIWSIGGAAPDGSYHRDLVECLYLYDLGVAADDRFGPYRQYLGARMWFAPGIGPVAWQEHGVFAVRTAYGGGTRVRIDSRAVLTEADLAEAP